MFSESQVSVLPPRKAKRQRRRSFEPEAAASAIKPLLSCGNIFQQLFDESMRGYARPTNRAVADFVSQASTKTKLAVFFTGSPADHSRACSRLVDDLSTGSSDRVALLDSVDTRSVATMLRALGFLFFGVRSAKKTSMETLIKLRDQYSGSGQAQYVAQYVVVITFCDQADHSVLTVSAPQQAPCSCLNI